MISRNSGMYCLENLVRARDPSRRFRDEAPSGIGGVGHGGGGGNVKTDTADPPSGTMLKRAVDEPSAPRGADEEEPEYEVIDLMYERTGTLSFPYPSRIADSNGRAAEPAGATPEAKGVPSVGSDSSVWSSQGRFVRDLRAASAGTSGVSILATVDVGGGEPASTVRRREPSAPTALAEAKTSSPPPTRISRAGTSPRTVLQQVALEPALVRPRPGSVLANRALSKVAQTFVASPSPPPSRGIDASRGLAAFEARSCAPVSHAKRRSRSSYPSFGQRVLAEVRRIPLAKRIATLSVVAAVGVMAAVGVASSKPVPGPVPEEAVASRSSVAAVVADRAPVPPPARVEPRDVEPRVRVLVAEAPSESPNAMLAHWTPLPAPEETLPEPTPRRAPASKMRQSKPIHDRASTASDGGGTEEVTLARPALDARLTGDRSKGALATARSKPSLPKRAKRAKACNCFPGDPLCGCLD